jgi:hypothetical protein
MLLRPPQRAYDERGAVLVWVAIFMPILLLFGSFAIDTGNWFVHQRHLQTQVDAAALAGGSRWAYPCSSTISASIRSTARDYAGPHVGFATAQYNPQVGGTPASRMHVLLNSSEFWNKGGADYLGTTYGDNVCQEGYLDVKGTESNLPFLFKFLNTVLPVGSSCAAPTPKIASTVCAINARARVSVLQASAVSGSLPIGVRDPNVRSAAVVFMNNATKTVIAAKELEKQPGSSAAGFARWRNTTAVNVAIAPATVAVFALSSLDPGSIPIPSPGDDANAYCSLTSIDCMESSSTGVGTGLVYIRGYSDTPAAAIDSPPQLRGVWLVAGPSTSTCNTLDVDSWFSYYQQKKKGTCTIGLRATIDLGGRNPAHVDILASGGTCTGCTVSKPTGSGTTWTVNIPIESESASNPISLTWEVTNGTMKTGPGPTDFVTCKNSSNPPQCKGSFGVAQQHFSGSDPDSGPIRVAEVWDAADATARNTYVAGTVRPLIGEIHLGGAIATAVTDPPVAFRIAGTSLTGSVDCDPGYTAREQVAWGCRPLYQKNAIPSNPNPCRHPVTGAVMTTKIDLWASPQPWDCVSVGTGAGAGGFVGPFTDGIISRILNGGVLCTGGGCPSSCPANAGATTFVAGRNYWDSRSSSTDNTYKGVGWSDSGFLGFDPKDPRVVGVFMVPFGAFRTASDKLYPVINFGVFYVTGWTGSGGKDDPCPGFDQPTGAARARIGAGVLYGHFIKYVLPSNVGGGGGSCDMASFTPCVAVLTD